MRCRPHLPFFTLSCLFFFSLAAVSFAAPDQALLARAKQLQEDLLQDLETLVNIDSPSGYGAGSEKIMLVLSEKLRNGNDTVWMGTAAIDSMGLVGGKGHTADEYIDIDKIPPRLYLLARMLIELGAQK
jgi:acetylornithine deacetylase/succinyl-diaminopimelate desuccinylase-like protein